MKFSDMEAIRNLDFFSPLDDKIIRNLARQCFGRDFQTGDFIVRQGEAGLGVYFILSGRCRVEVESGGSRTVVAELGPRDSVGELAIVDDKARSASVICTEPTKCLLLTRDSFSKLMNKHPQIPVQMVKALTARLRATTARAAGAAQAAAAAPIPAPQVKAAAAAAAEKKPAVLIESLPFPFSAPVQVFDTYRGAKEKVKDALVSAFTPIYAARTMTKFSMAVIGCPVTVRPEDAGPDVAAVTIDDVKVCFFPAGRNRTIGIDAYSDGEVSIAVLRPGSFGRLRTVVRKNERWRLHVPSRDGARGSDIWMEAPDGEKIVPDDCG